MYESSQRKYKERAQSNPSQKRTKPSHLDGVTIMTTKEYKKKHMTKIIGITGKAGSGKDTAADFIKEVHIKSQVTSFAKVLKEAASIITGLDPFYFDSRNPAREEVHPKIGKSPRQILKLLGTECARDILDENVWVNHVKDEYLSAKTSYQNIEYFVITDVRFNNEAEWIIENGGSIIQIERNVPNDRRTDSRHATESGILNSYINHRVLNYGTLEEFNLNTLRIIDLIKAED